MEEIKLDSPLGAIAEREPGLIISGVSQTGGPGIELYLAKTAEGYGQAEVKDIPTVWVEDYWGSASAMEILKKYPVKPDVICAFDETSKAIDIASLKEAGIAEPSSEQIIVTGSPAFDEIANEKNRQEIQKEVRENLKIAEDEIFIAWMSGLPEGDLKSLKIFLNNLDNIELGEKKIVLTARIHPSVLSVESSSSQYKKEYEELLRTFKNGKTVDTMGKFETNKVAIAADIVATERSTEGVKAVYRGKPVLFMLLPGLAGDRLRNEIGMDTFPVIKSGASVGVFHEKDAKQAIINLLDREYQKSMREAQLKHHALDGQNTKRVVDAIEKLLTDR